MTLDQALPGPAGDTVRRRPGRRPNPVPYLLVLPALLLVAGLVGALLVLSLRSLEGAQGQVPSLAQYARIATSPHYLDHFTHSAWLAGAATLAAAVLGYPVAYYMERVGRPMRRAIMAFLAVVFFSDYVLRMFGLILVLGKTGIVNRLLVWSGAVDRPLSLMYNDFGVFVGLVSASLPFMILAINGVLARLDPRLPEAAALLGASPPRVFWHVTLPLSVPGIVSGGIIVFLLSLNSFVTPALLGGGFVEMVATFIYEQAINLFNLPLGAAAAMILFFVSMVLLVGVNGLFDRMGRRFGVREEGR
ncbi:ABC transporter permease [Arenibaculum sp.]|uniref:ABC transporter permease n=1 Tax=Arenibaculum sp. TaxID=2865862 RepID=UPI002E1520DB|nr:ABC transporter permease [Arenibaculum sp.]